MSLSSEQIWTAAAWLSLACLLLALALKMALTGRRFSVRARVLAGRRRSDRGYIFEALTAVVGCLIVGAVLYVVSESHPMPLRLAFAGAGATVLFTSAWWLFAWLRETFELKLAEGAHWKSEARQVAEALKARIERGDVRGELCRQVAERLGTGQASVFALSEGKWVCKASTIPARVGHEPGHEGLDFSALEPGRTHAPAVGRLAAPLGSGDAPGGQEWFTIQIEREPWEKPEVRSFVEECTRAGSAALWGEEIVKMAAEGRAARMAAERDRQVWHKAMGRLIPPDLPEIEGLDYGAEYWRGRSPQGQFLDLISLPKSALGVVMAEVDAGGVEAAVEIAQLQVVLRSRFQAYAEDLVELLQSTERALLLARQKPMPVRLFCARYTPSKRTLSYVNAGGLAPMLFRRGAEGAQVLRLTEVSAALASNPPGTFNMGEFMLMPGDLLAIPSRSVLAAKRNEDGEAYGDARLVDALVSWEGQRASDLVRLVLRGVEEFESGEGGLDRALIILKRAGAAGASV